jgi:hypothetical protein
MASVRRREDSGAGGRECSAEPTRTAAINGSRPMGQQSPTAMPASPLHRVVLRYAFGPKTRRTLPGTHFFSTTVPSNETLGSDTFTNSPSS